LPTLIARGVADAVDGFQPTDVVIHYTAQMWDAWRFGSPAAIQLARRARRAGARVILVAHELYLPFARRVDLAVAASLQRALLGVLLASSDRVLVTTETRAAEIRGASKLLGAPPPEVLRVGANALPAPRRRASTDPEAPRLGVFSTAGAGKRFDVILGAFAEIARALPKAELVLIGALGGADQPLVKKVHAQIEGHPARARIRITGGLPLAAVASEIADLDVYLHPMETGANTRSSTLPTAFGSGLPIVAVRGEDTDESLFHDGANLLFARDMSASAFAAASLRLLADRALAARVAEGARRLYAEHLSWGCVADRFLGEDAHLTGATGSKKT